MRLILAPMEGVLDHTMRDLLTRIGGYDRCVTEFVRVSYEKLPPRVFLRTCPELENGGKTPAGTPVFLQLLGGDPECMALNAQVAESLCVPGIDLNFGCPSKTVNSSDGGSVLLREPQRVHGIVKAVREAVSPHIPVTAKIRLGFYDSSLLEDIAHGIAEAGADELCVHARTRVHGYQPPAYWSEIARIRPHLNIPVIANGEIWSADNAHQAQQESGCNDLMLGRGSLSFPDLARSIKAAWQGESHTPLAWQDIHPLLVDYAAGFESAAPRYASGLIKQWLTYLRRQYPQADILFNTVKRMKHPAEIRAYIEIHHD